MNDPVAVLLVLGFVEWIQQPDYGALDMLVAIVEELGIGGAVGLAVGLAGGAGCCAACASRRPACTRSRRWRSRRSPSAAADVLHGSGFLAVYLAGLVHRQLGHARRGARSRPSTTASRGSRSSGCSSSLGLLVFPSQLRRRLARGDVLALVLVFVARPIATFAATVGMGFSFRERVALGWAGLRGAVPVVLATFPVIAGLAGSLEFFDIVFFAVLVSTLLQGTTFEWLSERLGRDDERGGDPDAVRRTRPRSARLGAEIAEFPVGGGRRGRGRARARARPAARGAAQRDHPRRAGDPAARLDARSRRATGCTCSSARRSRSSSASCSQRWREGRSGRGAIEPRRCRTARSSRAARGAPTTAIPAAPDDGRRHRGRRPAAHAARQGRARSSRWPTAATRSRGPCVAVGPTQPLQDIARRRLRRAQDDAERAWWREVIGALALP